MSQRQHQQRSVRTLSSRKRVRAGVLGILWSVTAATTTSVPVLGFVSPSLYMTNRRASLMQSPMASSWSPSFASSSSSSAVSSNSYTPTFPNRLSQEEQAALLLQAVEGRRIKAIESEIALKSSKLQPNMRAVAQAAGYGTEVDELQAAKDAAYKAREKLVTHNMGLVYYCVQDITGKSRLSMADDLIQEGAIGLARAVDKWNPEIGGKFSTYAVYWIRAAVLRGMAERSSGVVRVPEHMLAAIRKVTRAAQRLGLEQASWQEAHSAKMLAEEAGLTDKQLKQAIQVHERRSTLSFEAWMQQGKDFSTDLQANEETDNPLSSIEKEHLVNILSRYLRPREMEALSWRYGLKENHSRDYLAEAEMHLFGNKEEVSTGGKWGEAMSFTEVGKRMKCSAEYGRRLCHAALDKLRRAAAEGKLEPALLF